MWDSTVSVRSEAAQIRCEEDRMCDQIGRRILPACTSECIYVPCRHVSCGASLRPTPIWSREIHEEQHRWTTRWHKWSKAVRQYQIKVIFTSSHDNAREGWIILHFSIVQVHWPAGGRGASVSARSHQSVAMLLGRSCMCLEKTLMQEL